MNDFSGIFPEDLFYSCAGRPTATSLGILNRKFGPSMDVDRTVRRKEDYFPEMIPEVTPISEVLAIAQKMQGIVPMAITSASIMNSWTPRSTLRHGLGFRVFGKYSLTNSKIILQYVI